MPMPITLLALYPLGNRCRRCKPHAGTSLTNTGGWDVRMTGAAREAADFVVASSRKVSGNV
ncbi:hypothetical protein DEO72_LG8g843 [Vigna unguiculata]|uniref:Uncharacterized protein n=1 Tax=Vigna unguiculata TaxID=3917 RepID=A0A4D6MP78_VIGUN|nr:hypothetical protein DEO72_LG8g843 [Vigna unguiculata]